MREEQENIKKNKEYLEGLTQKNKFIDLKVCPACKSANIKIYGDIIGLYSPLSPVKYLCNNCGWIGRVTIEMTNKIGEKDEEVLEDIISMFSDEKK
ncbi:MAG: hypothetical protein EAX96_06760 [Candidatus Lokiarchaeota archaeon]|nr:hypothetical protein [Candidatus Lokiarchaeota archaeon]